MNIRDPLRPKNARLVPVLLSSPCVVPAVHLVCRELGGWYISIEVPMATNCFSQRHITVEDTMALNQFLTRYVSDPEKVLMEEFNMPKELKEMDLVAPEKTISLKEQLKKPKLDEVEF